MKYIFTDLDTDDAALEELRTFDIGKQIVNGVDAGWYVTDYLLAPGFSTDPKIVDNWLKERYQDQYSFVRTLADKHARVVAVWCTLSQ